MDKRIQQVVTRPYCVGSRYFTTAEEASRYCEAIDRVEKMPCFGTFDCYYIMLLTHQDVIDYGLYNNEDYECDLPAAILVTRNYIETDDGNLQNINREIMSLNRAEAEVKSYIQQEIYKYKEAVTSLGGELSLKWGNV